MSFPDENYFDVEASDVSQDGIERECVITACTAATAVSARCLSAGTGSEAAELMR